MKLTYRPDIDGLRAIAVLAVLFFHTKIPGFSGGFVGVDIFFVISGFLITKVLLKDINDGNFSIARFYERRIRRIFPALFSVIIFTIVTGAFLFDPKAYKDFSESILSTAFFYSNILFANQSGYFDTPSLQKPLLHTWSIAVEEQFYIAFPLLLVSIHRFFKSHYFLWLFLILSSSLAVSIYGVNQHQEKTYFLIQARAWELISGSLLALNILPITSSFFLKRLLSFTGIALILYSVFFYSEKTFFPGYNAITPVLGAAILIYNGIGDKLYGANKLLSKKPLVFIGIISYSLYLWHWPFVAFYEYTLFRPLNMLDSALIIVASFLTALVSWKYIEQPFRQSTTLRCSRIKLFTLSGLLMVTISLIAITIYRQDGMAYRYFNEKDSIPPKMSEDFVTEIDGIRICRIGSKNVPPSFIIWGDSHAGHLLQGLSEKSDKYNISGYTATMGSNIPLIGINNCSFNDKALLFIRSHTDIKTVILAGIWGAYSNGHRYKSIDSHEMQLKDATNRNTSKNNNDIMRDGFFRTVNKLHSLGLKVIIVSDVPEIGCSAPRLYMVKRILSGENINNYVPKRADYEEWNKEFLALTQKLSLQKNVEIIHPEEMLFDKDGNTLLMVNNIMIYNDADHLSTYGSHYIAPVFDQVCKKMSFSK
jgi:peptidoglycan/LPS O-acetylase OafA/YrhL